MTGRRIAAGLLAVLAVLGAKTLQANSTFNYLTSPIDIGPSTAGSWQDVNVSSYVPAGATGVIVEFINSGAVSHYGVRKKGSTDAFFNDSAKDNHHSWLMTGVDANRVFQVYTEGLQVKTYLVGYTMTGVTFFTNRIDKSLVTTGSFQPIDISANTGSDTAIGAIFTVHNASGSSVAYGLRKNGSTDNRVNILRADTATVGLIGVDQVEIAQMQIATTAVDLYLVGYVTSGAVFFTNAVNKSTGTPDSYQNVDITTNLVGSDDANGAIVEFFPSGGSRELGALRPNGATYDNYEAIDHSFAAIGIDSGDVFQQKIDVTALDLYLIGYTLGNCDGGNWWNCSWGARRKVTLKNSTRSSNLDNFPFLVCLDSSKVDYSKTQNSGQDIRFLDADDSTVLAHEIEYWNESGTSYVWVKVPRINASSDTDYIHMYYDNSGASDGQNKTAVWSNSYESVYHLHDDFTDSTGIHAAGTNNGSTDGTANRLAGDYQTFNGSSNYINTNWTSNYAASQSFTWEGWIKVGSITADDDLLGIEDRFAGAGDNSEIRLAVRENAAGGPNPVDSWQVFLWPDSGTAYTNAAAQTLNSSWHHLGVVRDGSTARTYLDGSQVHSAAVGTAALNFPTRSPWTTTNRLLIGAQWNTDGANGTARNFLAGDIDEVRTSIGVARSADWMDATYDSIATCGTFSTISQESTTAVELLSFGAKALDGAVELTWETASEIDNLAFRIHRATAEEGPYDGVSSGNAVPGLGSSAAGARYSYLDTGLTNGQTYYYKLEDVERSGETKLYGPVSATPEAGASVAIVEGEEGKGEESDSSRITYGRPWENEVRFQRIGRRGAVLELITQGFYAYPEADGTVRLEIPGLDLVAEPGEPAVPVYQGWIDAVPGRRVELGKPLVDDVQEFTELRPSAADAPDLIGSPDGTVQAGVKKAKRAFLHQDGLYPEEPARLVDLAFQDGEKKALVELAPLRWDGEARRLLMARRLQVRVSFLGREPSEKVIAGGGGRRHVENHARRNVLAQLVTQEAGLHGVRFEDIFGNNGKPRKTSELRLSRQGETVAFRVVPGSRNFERGSTLYFIGEGADANPYGDEAVYELEASRSGLLMERVIGAPNGSAVPQYWKTLRREENRLYQAAYIEAEDVWQWDWIFGPMTKSFPFQVTDLASVSDPAQLDIWLQGASDFPEEPDHHARVYVNGTWVAEEWWDGEPGVHLTAELVAGVLHEGDNILQVEEVGDTDALYSMIMLDRFEVKYPAQVVAHEGELKGSFGQSGTAWVSNVEKGFVFDLTAEHPSWLDRVNHANGVGFGTVEGHQYLVVGEEAVRSPEVRKPLQTSLGSEANAAEYLVIGPRAFLSAAEPLLRYRMNEGLRTKAVAVEDVLAEFGYGEATPDAIHDFLSYAYHHWTEPSLRYVLLLGDASYDPKDYLKTGVRNQVPVKLVKTRYMWTASDPWLAAVNGEDILPDVAIGRLPAASVEEVKALVEKILVYETGESDPDAPIVLITDNPDAAGDFDWNADVLAATVLSGQNVEKIYLSELGTTATRSAIRNAFDEGASVMSYIGHGAIHLWANENLLNVGNVGSLSPQSEQPLLFTMNCLNGYFHFPYQNSLAEALLKAEGKGIIAAFSPTGLSLDEPAHRFHRALLDHVVNQEHERLGDAILAGQSDYADSGAFPELLSIYHLLGDPALKLR